MTQPDGTESAAVGSDPFEGQFRSNNELSYHTANDADNNSRTGHVSAESSISGPGDGEPLGARYTSGEYLAETTDWHEGRAEWKAEQVARMLAKHQIEPRSICDIGCGTGGVLDSLGSIMSTEPALTGYEVASQPFDLAPADRRERIELINGSYDDDDRRFDLLLALDVFEHLEDYYGFLRNIRVKAPLAIFHIPIDTAVTTVLRPGPAVRSVHTVGHIQHYMPALALETLRYAGYTVLDHEYTVPARGAKPTSMRGWVGKLARLSLARLNVDLAARLVTGFSLLVLAETGSAAD